MGLKKSHAHAKLNANDERMLERVQRATFQFFLDRQDPDTGLILDRSELNSPATIAGVGFALPVYAVAVERFWITREDAVAYALKVLRVLASAPQGDAKEGMSGYRGWFYHFLDPKTGLRATAPKFWDSELSSIDTGLLIAGVLFARTYFVKRNKGENEIRRLCDFLFERVDWNWLVHDDFLIGHGWSPEGGLIKNVYSGYSEAPILYLMALASKRNAVPSQCWTALLQNSKAESLLGSKPYIAMPGTPLFCYQYPHCFVDFRGIQDDVNRRLGFDYYENSVRATDAQHRYAVANPNMWRGYNALDWGLTACDGPGNGTKVVDGKSRQFRGYSERGAPRGFDDGTIAPTAAISSLPYAPRKVLRTMRHWLKNRPEIFSYSGGFIDSFNPTYDTTKPSGWIDIDRNAIDQGPMILMIENYRSDFTWNIMRQSAPLKRALRRAGFRGGWLDQSA